MGSCVAFNCTNRCSKKIPGLTFHSFPKEETRRKLWIKAVRRANWEPNKFSKLCSNHFSEEMIDRTSLSIVRLRDNAVPSIFDFSSHLQKEGKSILCKTGNPSSALNAGVIDFKSLYKAALDQVEETQRDLSMEKRENLRLKKEIIGIKTDLNLEKQENRQLRQLIERMRMPQNNLFTYKRRKMTQQEKNSCTISEAELDEKVQDLGNLNIGLISDSHLNNPVKKEYNYPDTRYQHSTTLFPAEALENCLPLETSNEMSKHFVVGELIFTTPKNGKIDSDSTKTLKAPSNLPSEALENSLPLGTINKISKHCTVGELIPTMPKKGEIGSDSTKTVEPIISDDVKILEAPTRKVEVIDLTDRSCSVHTITCRCTPVRTSYIQNKLPGKPNTIFQGNADINVKVESCGKKTCEVISDATGAADINTPFDNHFTIEIKSEKSAELKQ